MFKRIFLLTTVILDLCFAGQNLQLSLLGDGKVSTDIKSIGVKLSKPLFKRDKTGSFTHKEIIKCTPFIKAAFEYEEADRIKILPLKPLKASQTYECRLQKPLSYPFTFSTKPFALKDIRYFDEGTIRVEFNDKVDKNSLQNSLKIFKKINLAKVKLSFVLDTDEQSRVFLARIKENVADEEIEVVIDDSLKNQSGKKLSKKVSKSFKKDEKPFVLDKKRKSMPIYDKPRFLALDNGEIGFRLYLAGYIYNDETPLKSYLFIKGVKNFHTTNSRYIGYKEREKYNLNDNSVSYIDVIGDFEPDKTYTITLKKGLKDSYRYQLRKDITFKVKMGDRKSAVIFENKKPYLSQKGEIGFKSVNLDSVTIIIEKIPEQNYRYFTNFKDADEEAISDFGVEIFSKKVILSNKKNRFTKQKIRLNEIVSNYKSGIFRIIFRNEKIYAKKVVFLSDIGISAKISNDQAFISTAKLSDTTAVKDAKVKLFSIKNTLIASGQTDENGICIIKKEGLAKEMPHLVVVESKDDKNFLVLNESLNEVTLPFESSIYENYKAWIYIQSRLIRPGGTLKTLIVIKDKKFNSIPNLPLKLKITSPDFKTIYKNIHKSDKNGAIEFSLKIPKFFKTGRYRIDISLDKRSIGTKSFFVESFLPQNIKNSIKLKKEIYQKDEPLEVEISSSYLFGAAASKLPAQIRVTAVAKEYKNRKYENYSFTNSLLEEENEVSYLDMTKNLFLNEKGKAKVIFPLNITQKPPSILKAQIAVSVFDNGSEVTEYKSIDIYPYKKLVGVFIDKDFIQKGEEITINSALLDPLSGKNQKRVLNAVLKKIIWRYAYNERGFYQWEKEYENMEDFEITTGEPLKKRIDESGDYLIEVYDRLGGHSAIKEFGVGGWDYTNISPSDDLKKVQIDIPKKLYKKGDILKVSVKSPLLKARVLFTIEGDRVLWHKTLYIQKGSATVDIPLDFDLKEGVYLHVNAIRATDTPSVLIPFRARNSVFIKPDLTRHRLKPVIKSPSFSKSNKTVSIEIKTAPLANVLVSVVDEGILQIIDQKPPSPFDFFITIPQEKTALYDLYQKVMHYLTEGKILKFGSGEADEMMMSRKHQTPDTDAKRVKPFMYWSGLLKSDKDGIVKTDLKIPPFNGKAKIAVIAFTKDKTGATSKDLIIKDEIIIKPIYPLFLNNKDKIAVPIRVFNTTKDDLTLKMQIESSKNISLSFIPDTITIPKKSSKVIQTTLFANGLGKGEIKVSASYKDKEFFHKVELPIISPDSLQTKVYTGESDKKVEIVIPKEYLKNPGAKVKITLDKTYKARIKGKTGDLINYPYGCAEQVSSRLLALLYAKDFLGDDEYSKELLKDRDIFIKEGILKLMTLQIPNGDFAYWRDAKINPYASIYASDVLISLKKEGFEVPQKMMERLYKALGEIAIRGREYDRIKYSKFDRIYAAYLLSNENRLPLSTLNMMYDNDFYKNTLPSLYMMAAMLKNAALNTQMKKVLSEIEAFDYNSLPNERETGGDFYSKTRDLAFALYLHIRHFKKDKQAYRLLEKTAKSFEHLYCTQDKAFALRAMALYYKDAKEGEMKVLLSLNGKKREIKKPTTVFEMLKNNKIEIEGKHFNYDLQISGYLPLKTDAPNKKFDKKLNIYREFVNEKGKKINIKNLKQGDLIYSKVIVQSKEAIENVVINERIPSCFEIVNERLGESMRSPNVRNSKNFYPQSVDIRDDRILTFLDLNRPVVFYDRKTKSKRRVKNTILFFTPMRVVSKGICKMPPIITEAMYDPRISDYSKNSDEIEVK